MSPDFDQLVALTYGSLIGPDGHAAFVRGLARTFRSHLVARQVDSPSHQHAALAHYDDLGRFMPEPEALSAGQDYVNPWFESPMVVHFYRDGLADDKGCVQPSELRRTPFHADIMQPLDVFHSTGFLLEQGKLTSVLSISRSQRIGYYTEQELEWAKALLPHIQNVHAIQKTLVASALSMEAKSQRPAWLLSDSGKPCGLNPAAARARDATDAVLTEHAGSLRPLNPQDRQVFSALLASVLSGQRWHGRVALRDAQGTPRCVAHVHYCRREAFQTWLLTDPPAALVCLHPLDPDIDSLPPTLKHLYGLSPAECRVAIGMLESSSTRQVAESLARSEETVRSQLKAIYAKTGMHTQAQLLKLLYALSAG